MGGGRRRCGHLGRWARPRQEVIVELRPGRRWRVGSSRRSLTAQIKVVAGLGAGVDRRGRGSGKGEGRIGEASNPGPLEGKEQESDRAVGTLTVEEAWERVQQDREWVPAWKTWARQVIRPVGPGRPVEVDLVPPLVAEEEAERAGAGDGEWEEEDLETFLQQCELEAGLIQEVDVVEAKGRASSWRAWEDEMVMAGISPPRIDEQTPSGGEGRGLVTMEVAKRVQPPPPRVQQSAVRNEGGKKRRQRWKPLDIRAAAGEPPIEEALDLEGGTGQPDAAGPLQLVPSRSATVRPRGRRQRGGPAELYDVDVVSFNGSGQPQAVQALASLKEENKKTAVVLIQEHLARGDAVADLQHAARRYGYKLAPSEAAQGKGGGPSAGVAIAVPLHRGWGGIQGPVWDLSPAASPGRLVGAWVQAGPRGGIFCFTVYLWTSEGMSPRNVGLVEAALAAAATCGGAWIVGADWNVTPTELKGAVGRLLDRAGAVVRAPAEATCYPPTGCPRVLDYFLVDARIGDAVSEASLERTVAGSPHRAVKVTVKGSRVRGLVQMVQRPRMFPRNRPIGCPRQPLVPGRGAGESGGQEGEGREGRDLEAEWRGIAHCIESELCRECDFVKSDGTPDERYMGRGDGLRLVRRPLMPPRTSARHGRADGRLHDLAWTLNRMEELAHLAARGREGSRRGAQQEESRRVQWERIVHSMSKRGGCVEKLVGSEGGWEAMAEQVKRLQGCPMEGLGEIREWASKLRRALDDRKHAVAVEGRLAWKAWVRDQLRRGGGALHAFTKREVEKAEVAVEGGGERCGSPQTHVEADRIEWDRTWQRLSGIAKSPWRGEGGDGEEWACIPPPSVQELRKAARRFRPYTGVGADLLRPHWFGWLSDQLLQVISQFMASIEERGRWPGQVLVVLVHLIPKDGGGGAGP